MDTVKLTTGYRFTIPEKTRRKLGIKPGQKFSVMERNGTIVLVPLPDDPIDFLYGRLKGRPSMTAELLAERARDLEHE